jgi:cell division protein FtsA
MSFSVTVLDIGSSKVVALAASLGADGKVKLKGVAIADHRGIKKGTITDSAAIAQAIDGALRRLAQSTKEEAQGLVVGIGGPQVEATVAQGFVQIIPKGRAITREDVLQVINHSRQLMVPPGKEQIQVVPREFRIDGQGGIQEPVGLSGSRLEVAAIVVLGDAFEVQSLEKAVNAAGQKVEQLAYKPLGSALGVMTAKEIEGGTAVIDLGSGSTDVAVLQHGALAFAVSLPVGSGHITSDLQQLLKVSPEEAERLKVEHGAAKAEEVPEKDTVQVHQGDQPQARPMQRRVLAEIIESRAKEIVKLAKAQLDKAGLSNLSGGVVLTGGGAKLPGLESLVQDAFPHMKVRTAEPNLQGLVETRPGLASAVGLARFALQVGEDELVPATGIGNWKDRISRLFRR